MHTIITESIVAMKAADQFGKESSLIDMFDVSHDQFAKLPCNLSSSLFKLEGIRSIHIVENTSGDQIQNIIQLIYSVKRPAGLDSVFNGSEKTLEQK